MVDIVNFVLKDKYKNIIGGLVNNNGILSIILDTSNRYWYAKGMSLVRDISKKFSDIDVERVDDVILIRKK